MTTRAHHIYDYFNQLVLVRRQLASVSDMIDDLDDNMSQTALVFGLAYDFAQTPDGALGARLAAQDRAGQQAFKEEHERLLVAGRTAMTEITTPVLQRAVALNVGALRLSDLLRDAASITPESLDQLRQLSEQIDAVLPQISGIVTDCVCRLAAFSPSGTTALLPRPRGRLT